PPSSHFYVDKSKYEDFLQTLELNYFITKYNEQKDQDSRDIMSFYSLNYGLCVKENINYGRGKDRKYVIQRRFNYNFLIEKFLEQAKSIECDNGNCAASFKMEQLDFLKMYDMLCPKCKIGKCEIRNVEIDLDEKPEEMLLLPVEYEILNSLRISPEQYPLELAQEIDCTVQKIRRIIDKLEEKGLVKRDKDGTNANARTIYLLEPKAQIYFK
ncbi:MarR family transcriptional regulator, partial [Lysinibacillus sp. NPDC056232]|uniref:MarR family transcriptional regulator n=1 Tax=Lysinibacillus sp. NPDC056232 TaxID=3345756 RepID=UPI0035D7E4A3